jgi:hypothetical protein
MAPPLNRATLFHRAALCGLTQFSAIYFFTIGNSPAARNGTFAHPPVGERLPVDEKRQTGIVRAGSGNGGDGGSASAAGW